MPGGDRTGPMGMGAMTGRAAGDRAGAGSPNPVPGRGHEMGFGWRCGARSRGFNGGGRRWRNMFRPNGLLGSMQILDHTAQDQKPAPEMEQQALMNKAESLQSELDIIRKRLGEIEIKTSTE